MLTGKNFPQWIPTLASILRSILCGYEHNNMKTSIKLLMAAVAGGALALSANATPTLTLDDLNGGPSVVITLVDGGVGDLNPLPGAVTYAGSIGNWFLNVTTGVTKPVIGSAASPEMDLASVNATGPAGGNLLITFSESGFIPSGTASAVIGGTLSHGGTLTYATGVNFGLLTLQSFSNGGNADIGFSGSQSGSFAVAPGYTLTQEVLIHHNATGITSFDAHLSVPDGGMTAGLLGFALVAIEGVRRKIVR
jgi:hypothetical protein